MHWKEPLPLDEPHGEKRMYAPFLLWKQTAIRYLLWLSIVFFISGCQPLSTEKITVVGGTLGGGWSAITEGVVNAIRREMPNFAITSEPGHDGANTALVNSGRVQFGLIHSGVGRLAMAGEYPYQHKLENIRGVSFIYSDSAFHFLVNERLGISSIEEIREKKYPLHLSVIYRGSLMEIASKAALEAYGMSYQDIESWGGKIFFLSLRTSLAMMKDGRIDAISVTVQFPQTSITEASLRQDLRILPLTEQAIEYANTKLGTYRSKIPAGTYSFVKTDIPTFSDTCVLIANAEVEEERVYEVIGAIFKNLDYLHKVHRALSTLTPSDMPRVNDLPLHPGAQRFYREKGVWSGGQ